MPAEFGFPCSGGYIAGLCGTTAADQINLQSAFFRENMLVARLDYNFNENMKGFVRLSYDNSNQIGPSNSQSNNRTQFNVPAAVVGLDWNHGQLSNSARFGYQKMVDAVNPALGDSAAAPFNIQIGSYALGRACRSAADDSARSFRALRRQHDSQLSHGTFWRSDSSHCAGRFFCPWKLWPSVTSSNGMDTIDAINGNPNLTPLIAGDPRGAADNR